MFKDIFSGDDMNMMYMGGGGSVDDHEASKMTTHGNSHHNMRTGMKRSNARV